MQMGKEGDSPDRKEKHDHLEQRLTATVVFKMSRRQYQEEMREKSC